MTPICITNNNTEIYPPEKGLMGGGTYYPIKKMIGEIFSSHWYSKDQVLALVKREGIKEGGVE